MRKIAASILLSALATCACDGNWASFLGGVGGRAGASGPTVVFLSNAVPEALPREEAAAWAWLQEREEFEVQHQQFADLDRISLPRGAVLWWHYAEQESLPSAAVRPATIEAVRRHLRSGGNLFLTLLASTYVSPLGVEPAPPNLISAGDPIFDDSEIAGLQSRLGHPLLRRFWGGVFTAGGTAMPAAAAAYARESWPATGRVWAVHKNERAVDPSYKIGVEYIDVASGTGDIVTLGAHVYFADDENHNRLQLEELVADALADLLERSGNAPRPAGTVTLVADQAAIETSSGDHVDGAGGRDDSEDFVFSPPVLDGQSRYWLPGATDVTSLALPPTTLPVPADPEVVLNAVAGSRSGAELTGYPGEDLPFTLASPLASANGSQLGRIDELWAHPARILRGLRFGIVRPERGVTWLDTGTGEHTFTARPEGAEIVYRDGDIEVGLHLTIDRRHAALVALLAVRSPAAVEVIATWEMDRAAAWPGGVRLFGPLQAGWDEGADAAVWSDESGEFVAMAGFGGQTELNVLGYDPAEHLSESGLTLSDEPGAAPSEAVSEVPDPEPAPSTEEVADNEPETIAPRLRVATQAHLEPGRPALLPFAVVAGNPGGLDLNRAFVELVSDPGRPWVDNATHYREFLDARSMGLLLPDPRLEQAFEWAKVGVEALRTTAPSVGTGIFSGSGPRRPEDAWIATTNGFGGSGALWAAMAADAYGDRGLAADTLRLMARYQSLDGRLPAAVSASWEMSYDRAADSPLFVIAVENHVRTWGDRQLLEDLWPAAVRALEFGLAADPDGDGLIDGIGSLDRWGADRRIATTIELAGLWGAALEAAERMALWRGDDQGAARWGDQAAIVRESLNADTQFWNPTGRGFNFAKRRDGTFVTVPTVLPAVPAIFGLLDAGIAGAALDSFTGAGLASDWGVALTGNEPPAEAQAGETAGLEGDRLGTPRIAADLVSPLFTGWASLAEYAYHREEAGFAHAATNLLLLEHHNLGYAAGALSRSEFSYPPAAAHAAASQALAILPVTRGLLGIFPDAMSGTLEVIPHLPAGWGRVIVQRLRMGDDEFRVIIERTPTQQQFEIIRRRGNNPVNLRLGVHVPSDVPVGLDPNLVGATIVTDEVIEDSAVDKSSTVVVQMTERSATIAFNHGEYPRLVPPLARVDLERGLEDVVLQPGRGSDGLRVVRTRYFDGTLTAMLEGLPGRTYRLRLATPWTVRQVTGVPDASFDHPELGWATIDIAIPGSGARYRPIELEVTFDR